MGDSVELRVMISTEDAAIIDGYCQATGKNRTDIMRALVHEWADKKLHEAIVVCRMARINPLASEA